MNDIELDIPTGEEANGILLQRFDKIEQLCTNVVQKTGIAAYLAEY